MDTVVSDWTWVLHSSLLIVAAYGRFARVWSIRNLDLLVLIGLTPALRVFDNRPWMLVVLTTVLVLRLIFDCRFRRRPRVEPNMNVRGLSFLGAAAFIVLMVRVFTLQPTELKPIRKADNVLTRTRTTEPDSKPTATVVAAPALAISRNIEAAAGPVDAGATNAPGSSTERLAMRIVAVVAHTAVVLGLLLMGAVHFKSLALGVAMATLYLLLPWTALYVHRVNHALPAAFLIWAFVSYRKPLVAGIMLGLGSGALFSTAFLLPLWCAYYGRQRMFRFVIGVCVTGLLLTVPFILTSLPGELTGRFLASMNWSLVNALDFARSADAADWMDQIRPHLMIVFGCVCFSLTMWPRQKELGHLIAHSTVLVVLAQLWYPEETWIYMMWYLPALLLVVFRPRLPRQRQTEEPSAGEEHTHLPPPQVADATPRAAARSLYR